MDYGKVEEAAEERAFQRNTCKRKIIITIASVVLGAIIVVGTLVGSFAIHKTKSHSNALPPTQPSSATALKAFCSVTLYPDACVSSISSLDSSGTTDPVELFRLSLRVAIAEHSKLSALPAEFSAQSDDAGLSKALAVCETVLDDAVDRLHDSISSMEVKEGEKLLLSDSKIDDIRTWLSTTITDQETCLDALKEFNSTIVTQVQTAMLNSTIFASNSLDIVAHLFDILPGSNIAVHRQLRSFSNPDWQDWVGPGERRLLQDSNPKPNVTVAADGTGDCKTIQEAVEKVPNKTERFVIYVKEGKYFENVIVNKSKWNVLIYGDGKNKSIVSASLNRADGIQTHATATFAAFGKGFMAKDMGFENTAGPVKQQAVAFHSGSDMSVFYRCLFDGFQDTLYAHSNRQFYRECDIRGTVDFVFGNAAAVFQNCTIQPRQPLPGQFNTITAQGKIIPNQNTGISIQKCTITPLDNVTASTYLGRPWKNHSTTIIMQSNIGSFLNPKGWAEWESHEPPSTIFYSEYQNTGEGAALAQRVKWAGYFPNITEDETAKFTVGTFINKGNWLPATGVPYDARF